MRARIPRLAARSLSRATRPYSTAPPQLDVDDAHLLPPANPSLSASDERRPLHDIADALHLPIGDELHLADAGLEPPPVLEQNAPEPESAAAPEHDPATRELYEDSVLGLTKEPSWDNYNSRRAVVEVHGGVRHMANAFAVIRYLERTYGRVSHFNLARSADVEEDYRGAIFATFKHPLSVQQLPPDTHEENQVLIPEPRLIVPFRTGSVGLDELGEVLPRAVGEFGDAERQKLFDEQAAAAARVQDRAKRRKAAKAGKLTEELEGQMTRARGAEELEDWDSSEDAAPSDTSSYFPDGGAEAGASTQRGEAGASVRPADAAELAEEEEVEMVEVDGQMWPASVARELQRNNLASLSSWSNTEDDSPINNASLLGKPTGAVKPTEEDEVEMIEVDGQMWPASVAKELQRNHLASLTSWANTEDAAPMDTSSLLSLSGKSRFQDEDAEARARELEGNLPQLYIKLMPYTHSSEMYRGPCCVFVRPSLPASDTFSPLSRSAHGAARTCHRAPVSRAAVRHRPGARLLPRLLAPHRDEPAHARRPAQVAAVHPERAAAAPRSRHAARRRVCTGARARGRARAAAAPDVGPQARAHHPRGARGGRPGRG